MYFYTKGVLRAKEGETCAGRLDIRCENGLRCALNSDIDQIDIADITDKDFEGTCVKECKNPKTNKHFIFIYG